MLPPKTDVLEARIALASDPPQIILLALPAPRFELFQQYWNGFGMNIIHTKTLGIEENSNIAYRKYPGRDVLFPLMQHITPNFGFLLFLCLVLMSGALTVVRRKAKVLIENTLKLVAYMFSPLKPKVIKTKQSYSMILIGSWLISALVISISIRNYILEDMVIVIPNRVIDSWDDLKNRPEVTIRAMRNDLIIEYASNSDEEMALNFRERIISFYFDSLLKKSFMNELSLELNSGQSALILNRKTLIYTLIYMNYIINGNDPQFLKNFHVSNYGGQHVPYFTFLIKSTGWFLLELFNQM